jgi:phospholipid/cholesterol/gamma-HCH transport system ATP-binding protein
MIRFDSVFKSFGTNEVLTGLNLEIPDQQTTVILGYSGTGKSVALKLICGLLAPDAGQVIVDDRVVSALGRDELLQFRGEIGFVFQFAALFDSMTVGDNLRLGLRRRGLDQATMEERTRESLSMVDLPDAADLYPAELSGGMRKRVGIARAIALRPRYILYDEPTTGLDPVTSAVIDQLIVRTQRELGVTGVVVTHDLRSAYTVGHRMAMLFRGTIRQSGTVEEMKASTDPVVRQFLEGRPDGPAEYTGTHPGTSSFAATLRQEPR